MAPDRPIASLVPERCAIFVEGPGLSRLLAQGLDHDFVRAFFASPLGMKLLAAAPLAPSRGVRARGCVARNLDDSSRASSRRRARVWASTPRAGRSSS